MKRKDTKRLERALSLYIRRRGSCEWCDTLGPNDKPEPSKRHKSLQLAHILPKGSYPSLRLCPLNVLCLCYYHHLGVFHHNPVVAWDWLGSYLKPERLSWIKEQVQAPGKVPSVEEVLEEWAKYGFKV